MYVQVCTCPFLQFVMVVLVGSRVGELAHVVLYLVILTPDYLGSYSIRIEKFWVT